MITTDINGIPLTSAYDDAVKAESRDFDCRILLDSQELDCSIVSIQVDKGHVGTDVFSIGNVISTHLIASLKGVSSAIRGSTFEVQIGLDTGENRVYTRLANATVTHARTTRYVTTVEAYGPLTTTTGAEFIPPANQTIANVAAVCAAAMGVTISFGSGIDTTLTIDADLSGMTVYNVLRVLALCCGGNAVETPDGNVMIVQPKRTADLNVDAGMMVELADAEEDDIEIHGVRVIVDPGDDETPATAYEYGSPIDLEIESSYITSAIFNAHIKTLVGYTYRPANCNLSLGDPRIEGNDLITVTDVEGDVYNTPIHQIQHHYDGGFYSIITAVQGTDQSNDIHSSGPIARIIETVEKLPKKAIRIARQAISIASNTAQYFWMAETGTDTGAHITEIPREDFETDPQNGGGNLLARSNGVAIRDGLTELSVFAADGVRVGREDENHSLATQYSYNLKKGTHVFFSVYDLQGEDVIETVFYPYRAGSSIIRNIPLGAIPDEILSVQVNGTDTSYTVSGTDVRVSSGSIGDEIRVRWTTAETVAGLIFGSGETGVRGAVFGENNSASGLDSLAEGVDTTAGGYTSHAEGHGSKALGYASHAEGINTTATGIAAHSEGGSTKAKNPYSHASGQGTITDTDHQTVMGRYNAPASGSLLVVGKGSSDNDRSNAMQLTQYGNMTIAGTLTQASDKRLKEHIKYLDDDAVDFIRKLKPALYKKDEETHAGLYAQDVAEVDEWDCMTGEMNGYMTLAYTDLIAPLISYCQSLERRIEVLENENN